MSAAKKKLEAALRKTNGLPNTWFGTEEASFDDLPSVQKARRVRKNIYIEEVVAHDLEALCKEKNVSFTDVANDILKNFVLKAKKKSKA